MTSTEATSNGKPESKRQQRAAETAEQLLVAARTVFETKGYQATTVGAITEAAECAHGTFYLYFKNKEDAFTRVMEAVMEEMYRESQASWDGDAQQALERAIGGFLGVMQAHKGLWRCLMEGMLQNPAIERMWIDMRRPMVDRSAAVISYLQGQGLMRKTIDPEVAAHALGSMVEWFGFTHFELGEPPLRGDSFEGAVSTIADLWLHAVYGKVE